MTSRSRRGGFFSQEALAMGRIWRGLRLGLKSLMLHKLRSGLTALGLIFGVAAVISMLAVGEGASRDAQLRIEELGATNIILRSVKPSEEAQATAGRPAIILRYGLMYDDYERIVETVPTVKRVLPIREIRKQIRRREHAFDGRVVGTTHDYAEFNHLKVVKGRFLERSDDVQYRNYAVLAHATAEALFPYQDPIGETIVLGSGAYKVVGVTGERASTAASGGGLTGRDYNRDVYIPLNTCRVRFGELIIDIRSGGGSAEETQLTQLTVQVHSIDDVTPTVDVLRATYEPRHPKHDVQMTVPYDLLEEARRSARRFSIILGTIASISLLVGGIGIMNIMLATVTERTREIGIRRALGAKRRDIIQQFLVEGVVLSAFGGLAGVLLGMVIPRIIVYFAPDQKTIITAQSVFLAFGISVGVGILFGVYPARRAALMDPIEALRHE
jgi:putative ABC transport system permease protein